MYDLCFEITTNDCHIITHNQTITYQHISFTYASERRCLVSHDVQSSAAMIVEIQLPNRMRAPPSFAQWDFPSHTQARESSFH